jgi:hypothetical protein
MINNLIKGLVISGSYKDCFVNVLNEGFVSNGKIRIKNFNDICKYNIEIFKKTENCVGKKKVGETTFLNKDSILLQKNCTCNNELCTFSHLKEPIESKPIESKPIESKPIESKFYNLQILKDIKNKLDFLLYKYQNSDSKSAIISMHIAFDYIKNNLEYKFEEYAYIYTFIRMTSLCCRSLIESYCKEKTGKYSYSAKELVSISYQMGIFSKEMENLASDTLIFTNGIIHSSTEDKNMFLCLNRIDHALLFLKSIKI